jgi:hypothetical protein
LNQQDANGQPYADGKNLQGYLFDVASQETENDFRVNNDNHTCQKCQEAKNHDGRSHSSLPSVKLVTGLNCHYKAWRISGLVRRLVRLFCCPPTL